MEAPEPKTRPAITKEGREPNTTLFKCGWCGNGLFGTITNKKGAAPHWKPAEPLNSIWIEGEKGVYCLSHKRSDIYGDTRRRANRRQIKGVKIKEWKTNQREVRHGGISDPIDHPPLIWDWSMECPRRECLRVSIVNLRTWYEPHMRTRETLAT